MREIASQGLDQFLLGRMRAQTQIPQRVDRLKSGPIRYQEIVSLMMSEPSAGFGVERIGLIQPRHQKGGVRVDGHRRKSRRAAWASWAGAPSQSRSNSA